MNKQWGMTDSSAQSILLHQISPQTVKKFPSLFYGNGWFVTVFGVVRVVRCLVLCVW